MLGFLAPFSSAGPSFRDVKQAHHAPEEIDPGLDYILSRLVDETADHLLKNIKNLNGNFKNHYSTLMELLADESIVITNSD